MKPRFRIAFFLLAVVAVWTLPVAAQVASLTTLANFGLGNGELPNGFVGQAKDGNFYSTTVVGGANKVGSVYKMASNGAITLLHSFGGYDGKLPYAGLVEASDGNFYGATSHYGRGAYESYTTGGTVFRVSPQGEFTTLYNFCNLVKCQDGANPFGALIQASDGNLYSVTENGGAYGYCYLGCGSVFQITPQGAVKTIYSFCKQTNCTDGANPYGALIQASNGNFYGTTLYGGTNGLGTVFQLTPQGRLTTIYSFCSQPNCTDGLTPTPPLLQGRDGSLYGMAYSTVFKVTSGVLTTLYTFCAQPSCADGVQTSGMVQAGDGNFYGTTAYGGGVSCYRSSIGCGTFFRLTPAGQLTTLYRFCTDGSSTCADGAGPTGVALGSDGNFYGVTTGGGSREYGTAFKISVK